MSAKRGARLNLPGVEAVDMRQVKHRNKPSVLRDSNAFKNAVAIVLDVKHNGPFAPFEGYNILTMEDLRKTDPGLSRMKTAFASFRTEVAKLIKENGVEKDLVVVARGNSKIYLGNAHD